MIKKRDSKQKSYSDIKLMGRFFSITGSQKAALAVVYILYFTNSLLNLIPAASLRFYFDSVIQSADITFFGMVFKTASLNLTTAQRLDYSVIFFIAIIVLIVGANTIGVVMWRKGTRVTQKFILNLKLHVHYHLSRLSMSFFDRERTGRIMSRAVGDIEQLEAMIKQSFNIFYSMTHLVTAPIFMLGMNPVLFLFVLIPVPVVVFCVLRIRNKLRPLYREMREHQAGISASIQEQISGIKEIKAFNKEMAMRNKYARANINYVRAVHKAMKVFSVNHQVLYGTRDIAMILIGVAGGIMVILGTGNVTLGTIIAFIPLLGRFLDPIGQFVGFYDIMQRGLASAERIFEFLDVQPEIKDREDARRVSLSRGEVEFRDVNFHYGENVAVIKDVSFKVIPGQKVAIVGSTGSGKTSLISLLARFYQPQSGKIAIDGYDISKVKLESLTASIGIVFQETFLFYGTIAENIGFSKSDASLEEVREAARFANIDEFIETLPEKYETTVGERGTKLSGGQRQRISIARMILKNPAIIILDEATSAVDSKTEQSIQESLDLLMAGRTSFIIAHRLSTIRNSDMILVMHEGRLAEAGNHKELMARKGLYTNLVESAKL